MKHLVADIKTHFSHYFVLLLILGLGTFTLFFYQQFPKAQIASALITALFYVLWGVVHHYLEGDLHQRVVLEYLSVALLGFLILFSVINQI